MTASDATFFERFHSAFVDQTFVQLRLTDRAPGQDGLPRIQSARPIMLRGRQVLHWELQFEKQQTQVNLSLEESLQRVRELFPDAYRQALLRTTTFQLQSSATRSGVRERESGSNAAASTTHNRAKNYLLPEGAPCPFLFELEVMTAAGQVRPAKQKKFRQINRYLELVRDVAPPPRPDGRPLRIVDFGCGLSYLTFAVHHLFTHILQQPVEMWGVDSNPHVIERCSEIARRLEIGNLQFVTGRIGETELASEVDVVISLHACDTATDAALAWAVGRRAQVILAAPCCQHELAQQARAATLQPLLRHGILHERFCALATDGLRALALQASGYQTQLVEFIELEHTPKNLLLRAISKPSAESQRAEREYQETKAFWGVGKLATDAVLGARPFDVVKLDGPPAAGETAVPRVAARRQDGASPADDRHD